MSQITLMFHVCTQLSIIESLVDSSLIFALTYYSNAVLKIKVGVEIMYFL